VRRVWAGIILIVFSVGACGGGEISLTDYVERVNVIIDRAASRYEALVAGPGGEVLVAEAAQLDNFTPRDLQVAFEEVVAIEVEVRDAVGAIEPPEQIADLHNLLFDFSLSIPIGAAMAVRAGTAADWEELSATPEMAAYRDQLAYDKQVCTDFQTQLDATSERGAFADTPWIPDELKEVVDAVLGCVGFPANPEDVYRPAAP